MLVTEIISIKLENRYFQTGMMATIERNARRVEEQISGSFVDLKQTREELQAKRQRAINGECNLGERVDEQAAETTANRRKFETLESQVRSLEALVADAIGARDVKGPERSSKDGRAAATSATTTAKQGSLKSSKVSAKDKAIPKTKFLLET